MPIPDSWPPEVKVRASQFLALLKYYRMSRSISEAGAPYVERHLANSLCDSSDILRVNAFLSYWFASLYVVCEGWQALELSEPDIDSLLTTEHLEVLKQYRHTVFHFQRNLEQSRIGALERNHDILQWVFDLGSAFELFFDRHSEAIDVEAIRPWLFRHRPTTG